MSLVREREDEASHEADKIHGRSLVRWDVSHFKVDRVQKWKQLVIVFSVLSINDSRNQICFEWDEGHAVVA